MFRPNASRKRPAFTLIEVLVAMTILLVMLSLIFGIISQTSSVTRRASDKISSFQGARMAFETIERSLGQATLNSYWDYDDPNDAKKYLRKSELHFLVGQSGVPPFPGTPGTGQALFFQAPLGVNADAAKYRGLDGLLNACGYYVSYGDDPIPPVFQSKVLPTYRYRLMQTIQATENLLVYSDQTGNGWVEPMAAQSVPVADNIIYLLIWPRKPLAEDQLGTTLSTDFSYDSRLNASGDSQPETANQLPPLIQVTMVAIDEASAIRFCTSSAPPGVIDRATAGLFVDSSQAAFEGDLKKVGKNLSDAGIAYQIYTALVPLRESKMQ